MDPDVRAWVEQAEEDLATARFNLDGGRFPFAAFLAQQAAEKALKGLALARGDRLRKIHDLVALARSAHAPVGIESHCDALNPHYIDARYPTGLEAKYDRQDAAEAVASAVEVIAWVKTQL